MSTNAGVILVAVITVLGTIAVAVIARSGTKVTAANAFTANLLARLDAVEDQLEELQTKLTLSQRATIAAVRFIDRLADWGRAGGVGKMPQPSPELHEYLDPSMWEAAQDGPAA